MRTTGTVSKFRHINKQKGYSVYWTSHCVTVTGWKMCRFLVSTGQLHPSSEVCFPNAPQPQHSPRDHSKPNVVLSRAWCKQTQSPTNAKIQSSLKSRNILQPLQSRLRPGSHSLTIMSITDTSVTLLLAVAVQSFTAEQSEALNHSSLLGGRSSMGLILQ